MKARFEIIRLSALMIFAADHENFLILAIPVGQTHVMIRNRSGTRLHSGALGRVPKKRTRDRALWCAQADNVRRIRRLFVRRDHLGTFASHSFQHLRARENSAARSCDR